MATVDKNFADKMIALNGLDGDEAPDNPPIVKIIEYDNLSGGQGYGLVFSTDRDQGRYDRETEFIRKPRVYWTRTETTED